MYTSDRSEVYNYVGVKLTRGISTAKFCLLVTSEAQVGLRMCVNFFVSRNPRGKFYHQQSEVLSTSDIGQLGPTSGKKLRRRGQIRGTEGFGQNPTYSMSELSSFDCSLFAARHGLVIIISRHKVRPLFLLPPIKHISVYHDCYGLGAQVPSTEAHSQVLHHLSFVIMRVMAKQLIASQLSTFAW